MDHSYIDKINKMEIPIVPMPDAPTVLWIMASCGANRDELTFRDHAHTYFELHVCLEGSVTYGLGDSTIRLDAGGFLLAAPRVLHRVVACSEEFVKITVAFTVPEGGAFYRRLFERCGVGFALNDAMLDNFDFVKKCAEERGEYLPEAVKMRLAETVYHAADVMHAFSGSADNVRQSDSRVFRAMKYIDDNPQIFFGCEEVAYFCRVSSKHLGRLFKSETGFGLLEYIHARKLDAAKRLLRESNDSEVEIAAALGFACVQYFSKFFKRHTGKSPSEYRRRDL